MKITKLVAENFKRLTAVSISPDGSTVVLGGRNMAGKSSCLDAIEAALGGGKHLPTEPIHKGAKTARVVVETETLVVTRKFTSKGSALEVKAKDGALFASPQEMLNGLVGSLSFDPLAFSRLKPKEQAEQLRRLVGLDFAKEDAQRQQAYDKRTEVGRELKRLQGAVDSLPAPAAGTPDSEVSVAELAGVLNTQQQRNVDNAGRRQRLDMMRADAVRAKAAIERTEKQIAELQRQLEDHRKDFEVMAATGKQLSAEVATLVDEDLTVVQAQIANAEQTNAAVRAKRERNRLQAELDAQVDESEKLTDYIAQIDQVKAEAAAQAKYPIPGLAVTDDGLTLNGVPLSQASSAEQLRACVAIGLAMNPELKVLLIRDGSLLDADSLRLVGEMAEAAGGQVWLERVSTGDEVTVLIEDGAVAAADAA